VAAAVNKAFAERNAQISRMYIGGATLQECAEAHKISRERVRQVLRKLGVFKRHRVVKKSERNAFLGVNVSEPTKTALKEKAAAEGKSVSQLASEVLDEVVKP
jgi:DNA-binding CsgD family transcriptional regulator